MKIIETEFSSKGFNYKQIYREGLVCLYEVTKKGFEFIYYEVVTLKENPPFQIQGKDCGDCESYPRSEAWGKDGFTYTDRESAEVKFKKLKNKQK